MTEETKISSACFANLTFTLSMGSLSHEFKGEIFAKMSKKCATLLRQGITKAQIRRQIDQETFNAFVDACQLQPFKVTPKNAYELYRLAQEWGIPSLEKFAGDYIASKEIEEPERTDYVQILFEKCRNREVSQDDVLNVAADINEAMNDERFSRLPPEVIFQVLLAADNKEIDPQLLLDMTMRIFDQKASTAVATSLLMNFEKLTPEQRRKVISSEKMHDQNFDYFVAWALSALRDAANDGADQLKVRQKIKIAELAFAIDRARKVTKEAYMNLHKQEIEDFSERLERQQAELDELRERIKVQDEQFEQVEAQIQEGLIDLHKGVDEVKADGESTILEKTVQEQVQELLDEQTDKLREELTKAIDDAYQYHQGECDRIEKETNDMMAGPTQEIDQILQSFSDFHDKVKEMSDIVISNRSTLTAKIVRDKLRNDEYIRDNENRFEIFTDSSAKWDLTADQVREAEEMIEDLERGLNQLCPIRGNAQYSPPQSPRSSPKKAETERFQLEEDEEEEEEEAAYSRLSGSVASITH